MFSSKFWIFYLVEIDYIMCICILIYTPFCNIHTLSNTYMMCVCNIYLCIYTYIYIHIICMYIYNCIDLCHIYMFQHVSSIGFFQNSRCQGPAALEAPGRPDPMSQWMASYLAIDDVNSWMYNIYIYIYIKHIYFI